MSATTALIFLIEASAACGQPAPVRLGGEAELLPAILELGPQEFDVAAPTPAGFPIDSELDQDEPDVDPAEEQCKLAPSVIA